MKKLVYILVTVLLVLTACTRTSRHPQLVAADSLLLTQPDSALTLLRSMSFTDKADRMYHYLLLADACNKCYDTLPSDSILHEVTDYYDRHGSANEQVRAHYLLGCAYRDQGNAPLALNYYRIASEKADTLAANCDFLTLSRVYGQIAVLFHTQRAPRLEIEARKQAIRYAWKANDTISAIIFNEYLSGAYHMLNEIDSALYYNHESARMFKEIGRNDLAAGTLGFDIDIFLRRKESEKVKKSLDEYEHHSSYFQRNGEILKGREIYYSYKASYYEMIANMDSAEYYYRKTLYRNPNNNAKEAAYRGLLSIYRKSKNGDSIAKYSELYCQMNDSASFAHSADEITRMNALYNYDESERRAAREEKEADYYKNLLLLVVLFTALSSYFTFRIIKRQKRLRRQELIKANSSYTALLAKYIQAQHDLETAQQGLNDYRTLKEKEISSLQHEISAYQIESKQQQKWDIEQAMLHDAIVLHLHKMASNAQKASAVEWRDLNCLALEKLPSFINVICDESVQLTDKEIKVCILTRLHFIPTEMVALLDLTKQRITNIRANANRKLFNKEGAGSFDINIHNI